MAIGHVDSFVCANSPSNRVRLLFAIKSKIEDRNSYLLIWAGQNYFVFLSLLNKSSFSCFRIYILAYVNVSHANRPGIIKRI